MLSIQSIANIARNLARGGMEMRTAIHYVAEEYDIDPHLVACELSRRGCTVKKKKAIARKLVLEAEHKKDLEEYLNQRIVHDAYVQEHNYTRGFELAGHLDDY